MARAETKSTRRGKKLTRSGCVVPGASFAAELEHPERTFGKAMILSVFFVSASYIIPLLVALGASDSPQHEWKAGQLTVVAGEVGGHWLAAWTVLAAAASNLALFLAELSGDAYQVRMDELGRPFCTIAALTFTLFTASLWVWLTAVLFQNYLPSEVALKRPRMELFLGP